VDQLDLLVVTERAVDRAIERAVVIDRAVGRSSGSAANSEALGALGEGGVASYGLRLDEAGVWGVCGVAGVAVAPAASAAAAVERRDSAGAEERAVVRAVVVREGYASVVLVVAVSAGEGMGVSSASLLALCRPSPLTVRARRLRLRGGTLLDRVDRLRRPGRKLAPRDSASQLGFFGGMLDGLGLCGTVVGEEDLRDCEVASSDSSALNSTLAGVGPCGPRTTPASPSTSGVVDGA